MYCAHVAAEVRKRLAYSKDNDVLNTSGLDHKMQSSHTVTRHSENTTALTFRSKNVAMDSYAVQPMISFSAISIGPIILSQRSGG